jgi:hypothetical protein
MNIQCIDEFSAPEFQVRSQRISTAARSKFWWLSSAVKSGRKDMNLVEFNKFSSFFNIIDVNSYE